MKKKIEPATISWDKNGTPVSSQFDDPYFSRDDGLAESTQVFLDTNRLAERFAALKEDENFVVAETGFGTGLNFLLTWRCFQEHAPNTARLTYISIEGYPLRPDDLHKCLEHWPELKGLSAELQQRYPVLVPGHHCRLFAGRVGLHLIFDQIEPALQSLHPKITHHNFSQKIQGVDAWFLDGFAPAKNSEMWQDSIYPSIARLSHAGTTLSSFTSVGAVRRNLQDWGFKIDKLPGFGRKREMISGLFQPDWQPGIEHIRAHADKGAQTWHLPEVTNIAVKPNEISILGAGIAGLCLAKSLAQRGIPVKIYDRHPKALAGASGNPQVAIFGRLSPDNGDLEDFVMHALAYSADFYRESWQKGSGTRCGLLQLARSAKEQEKMQRLIDQLPSDNGLVDYVNAAKSLEYCGLSLADDGLWFQQSGWISPPEFANQILENPLIEFSGDLDLKPRYEAGHWQLVTPNGRVHCETTTLVVCSGAETLENELFGWIPIKPVAGQINLAPCTPETQNLSAILSKSTALLPANNHIHSLGGTYRLGETGLDIRQDDTEYNINNINEMINISKVIYTTDLAARTGVRATTPDYLPLCGPAPDVTQLNQDFAALAKDAKTATNKSATAHQGLYLNVGFGSRGYAYAPLCAEHLAAQICGDISPLPNHLQRAVHPARFPIRDIIRGK